MSISKGFSLSRLVLRTLSYYRGEIFVTAIAAAICSMVITGTLVTGNSVQHSLEKISAESLGSVKTAVTIQNKGITSGSIEKLKKLHCDSIAQAIMTNGYLGSSDGNRSVAISLYGIDSSFFKLAANSTLRKDIPELKAHEIIINRSTADHLGVKASDSVVLRFFKQSEMPGDAPFSLSRNDVKTIKLKVSAILESSAGGNFDMHVSQMLPMNGFLDINFLGKLLGNSNRANLVVSTLESGLSTKIADVLQLEDYDLKLSSADSSLELRSDNVFISDSLEKTIDEAALKTGIPTKKVFGYFVNSFQCGVSSVPYSFIAGIEESPLPDDCKDDEIVINRWLADELSASEGDEIIISAYITGNFGVLSERTDKFRLKVIIPMEGAALNRSFIPRFPGMEDAETCNDWDPDLPIDLKRVRQVDEDYWYKYNGLPKAFIKLSTAKKIWGNRFGSITLVKFKEANQKKLESALLSSLSPTSNISDISNISYTPVVSSISTSSKIPVFSTSSMTSLLPVVSPTPTVSVTSVHSIVPVASPTQSVSKPSVHSIVPVASPTPSVSVPSVHSVVPVASQNPSVSVPSVYSVVPVSPTPASMPSVVPYFPEVPLKADVLHERNLYAEKANGTSKAIDFTMLFMGLGFFIILAALLLTALLFALYLERRQIELSIMQIFGFNRRKIIQQLLAEAAVISIIGTVPGIILGIIYAWGMLNLLQTVWHGAVNIPEIDLFINYYALSAGFFLSVGASIFALAVTLRNFFKTPKADILSKETELTLKPCVSIRIPLAALVLSFTPIFFSAGTDGAMKSALFFAAGLLILFFTTQASAWLIIRLSNRPAMLSISTLALKNAVRKFDRSMSVIRIIACSIFLILAVSANHKGTPADPHRTISGTGGFSMYSETAVPLFGDINSREVRYSLKLDDLPEKTRIVQIPLAEGSDASCLNLNRVSIPSFLGIDPETFTDRFTFSSSAPGLKKSWQVLNHDFGDPFIIPAVADADVIRWNLGMALGDELKIESSNGQIFRIRLIAGLENSILQGKILISQKNFYRLWPDSKGSRVFLTQTSPGTEESAMKVISTAIQRFGAHIESTSARIASFNRVQNTYLSIFLALGIIGLILGCGSLAALILRNILERKNELEYLRIIGFSKQTIDSLLFREHALLFAAGLISGIISSTIAGQLPLYEITAITIMLTISGLTAIFTGIHRSAFNHS
ncbi:MAG: FtsX-like permease family protein [Candidatus Riflebacteria bacterium]|nr:FtsX-like permease family protein [Candidatus Riflebacteria bacterium]